MVTVDDDPAVQVDTPLLAPIQFMSSRCGAFIVTQSAPPITQP